MTKIEYDSKVIVGSEMRLIGFQSTSKIKAKAISFAFKDQELAGQKLRDLVPIVYQILFHSKDGIFDISPYSDYPDEEERLLQDGLNYKIEKVCSETDDKGRSYILVHLT